MISWSSNSVLRRKRKDSWYQRRGSPGELELPGMGWFPIYALREKQLLSFCYIGFSCDQCRSPWLHLLHVPRLDHSIWLLIMHQQLPFPPPFVLTLSDSRENCSIDSIWIQLMKNSVTSILDRLISGFAHTFALYTLRAISFISLEQIAISMERK